jgi:hypothetical protein
MQVLFLFLSTARAGLFDSQKVHLKVIATSVSVRSGPGGSFREIGRIGYGQVYVAQDRSPRGDWYRIRLARGLSGWVLAEFVWPFEIVDQSTFNKPIGWLDRYLLGKSPLEDGRICFSIGAGALDNSGLFTVRLGIQPSQHYLLEMTFGQSIGQFGSLTVYHADLLVFLGPWQAIVPYAVVGAGGATSYNHQNAPLFPSTSLPMAGAGGGLLIAIKDWATLRIDARQNVVFSSDDIWDMFSIVGGLMLSF